MLKYMCVNVCMTAEGSKILERKVHLRTSDEKLSKAFKQMIPKFSSLKHQSCITSQFGKARCQGAAELGISNLGCLTILQARPQPGLQAPRSLWSWR